MADFVFEWKGQRYPNIHGYVDNYDGGQLLQVYGKNNNRFANLETRYLNTMRAQLIAQQSSNSTKTFLEATEFLDFSKLEASIEESIVRNYNNFVDNFDQQLFGTYSDEDKEKALQGLDNLINAFKQNEDAISLINAINQARASSPILEDLPRLLKVEGFIKLIDKITSDKGIFSKGMLGSILTKPLKKLAQVIDFKANNIANKKIREAFNKKTSRTKVTYDFGDVNQKIITGASSVQLAKRNAKLGEYITTGENSVDNNFSLDVDSYALVRTQDTSNRYRSLRLASYGKSNSILMSELKKLYKNNSQLVDYQLYNTLANQKAGNHDLDENFKIIKSDVACDLAEKLIIGFESNLAQRVLIYNFRAYPMLSIISAIAKEGQEIIEAGGTYDQGNIFGITISGVNNQWIGGRKNSYLKYKRVQKVKKLIDEISINGRLDIKKFQAYIKSPKAQGIPLEGIIPRVKF